jgi:NDP-sugar pyrophosphorylase family protein
LKPNFDILRLVAAVTAHRHGTKQAHASGWRRTIKAVILAGGKGTRLAPYTTVLPKPLMPIDDMPILEIVLRQLRAHGVQEVTLTVGYLASLIRAYLDQSSLGQLLDLTYHHEAAPLGTAGALATVAGLDETFIAMNGDILTTLDYSALVRFHREQGATLTVAVTKKRVQIELGVLHLDDESRIIGYDEKPVKEYPASMGIYVYEPRALDFIEPNVYLDLPTLVRRLIERGEKVCGYESDAFWLDIGNRDDYERAVGEFARNRAAFLPPPAP